MAIVVSMEGLKDGSLVGTNVGDDETKEISVGCNDGLPDGDEIGSGCRGSSKIPKQVAL